MENKVFCNGVVELTLKDTKTQTIKETRKFKNRIVLGGMDIMASLLSIQDLAKPSHIACGTGTSVTTLVMTKLESEVYRVPFDIPNGTREGNVVTFIATFESGMPKMDNCAITEVGIFNAESDGVMFNRATFLPVNKAKDDELTIKWTITVTSADDFDPTTMASL